MEFKRINKDTVNCIITEDDMEEQGIKIEDLFERKKEAMDFLHDVMRRAEEEVDYKPTGAFMPMQVTVLPDHSISLMLTENAQASFSEILRTLTEKAGIKLPKKVLEDIGDSVDEERLTRLNEYLKSLKELKDSVKDIVDEPTSDTDDGKIFVSGSQSGEDNGDKADRISVKGRRRDKSEDLAGLGFNEFIFEFRDLSTVTSFCAMVPSDLVIRSSLYKNPADGRFYLDLIRGDIEPTVFASIFTMAYEFGHFKASNEHVIAHIKESYDCILFGDAIEKMSAISK